jgi:hypothetical protein
MKEWAGLGQEKVGELLTGVVGGVGEDNGESRKVVKAWPVLKVLSARFKGLFLSYSFLFTLISFRRRLIGFALDLMDSSHWRNDYQPLLHCPMHLQGPPRHRRFLPLWSFHSYLVRRRYKP